MQQLHFEDLYILYLVDLVYLALVIFPIHGSVSYYFQTGTTQWSISKHNKQSHLHEHYCTTTDTECPVNTVAEACAALDAFTKTL